MAMVYQPIDFSAIGDFAGSLDAGLDYLRRQCTWVIPLYTLAAAPRAILMLPIISAITIHRPSAASLYIRLLLPAIIWRWCWLTVLQQRVRLAVAGAVEPGRIRRRLIPIVIARLGLAVWVVWGSWLLVVPGLPALILAGMAAPALLDAPTTAPRHWARPLLGAITTGSTWKHFLAMVLMFAAVFSGITATVDILAGTVLPSFAGVTDTNLLLLLRSDALNLGFLFFVWMSFDLLWHISAVIHFYHMRARRNGADLQVRLAQLREAAA